MPKNSLIEWAARQQREARDWKRKWRQTNHQHQLMLVRVSELAWQKVLAEDEAAGCREAHARLDAAGVPSARRVACDDPTCQTQLGHRVKGLIAERDALRAALGYADHAEHCDLWDGGRDCSCGWSETAAALRGKETTDA